MTGIVGRRREDPSRARLRIDPAACDGIGMCAHLAPGQIGLDAWGYPLLSGLPLRRAERRRVAAAVAACPRRALFLDDGTSPG